VLNRHVVVHLRCGKESAGDRDWVRPDRIPAPQAPEPFVEVFVVLSLRVRGHRLEYTWIGPSPEVVPTLVFLHEGLGSVSLWRDFPGAVCARTGCSGLVYSRRGHGRSDPIDGPRSVRFMHEEALDELPEILALLGIARPILVGHSDGGSIALIHAGARPTEVRGLVLEAPHVFVEDVSVESIARMRTLYETTDLKTRMSRHHGDNTETMFRGWNDVWRCPEFRAWNLEEDLRRVTCPVLVIQGEGDEYGTRRQVDAVGAGVSGPFESLLLADCGHVPHVDQRALVEDAMVKFVLNEVLGAMVATEHAG
jgi:pimeloyl-ACP methyl ester carboxylesterase